MAAAWRETEERLPARPQAQDKFERFHQNPQKYLAALLLAADARQLQARLDAFRECDDGRRPHRAHHRPLPPGHTHHRRHERLETIVTSRHTAEHTIDAAKDYQPQKRPKPLHTEGLQ
ncbi:hypothetical protein GCM10022287_28100 [Gryllotalpicola koreensis]|uniref:Uncharacterized protein n=1 Tax=Gryllotalpicola koreensis TaxID=993086 RepID=A0ABP8A5A8_9MICO